MLLVHRCGSGYAIAYIYYTLQYTPSSLYYIHIFFAPTFRAIFAIFITATPRYAFSFTLSRHFLRLSDVLLDYIR